eukprot:gene23445-9542_t
MRVRGAGKVFSLDECATNRVRGTNGNPSVVVALE